VILTRFLARNALEISLGRWGKLTGKHPAQLCTYKILRLYKAKYIVILLLEYFVRARLGWYCIHSKYTPHPKAKSSLIEHTGRALKLCCQLTTQVIEPNGVCYTASSIVLDTYGNNRFKI